MKLRVATHTVTFSQDSLLIQEEEEVIVLVPNSVYVLWDINSHIKILQEIACITQ